MRIDIVGSGYEGRSLPFNPERMVNLYPEFDKDGRDVAVLYGTAGLSLFANIGAGAIRGGFRSYKNSRVFFVSAEMLYEVDSTGGSVVRGSLLKSSGCLTMTENETQMAICDGEHVYIFTYATNAFARVVDPDLPVSGTITSVDSFFVVNEVGTGKLYISEVGNGLSWSSLDFASAEYLPDKLTRVVGSFGQLWCFGEVTTELFVNTGASDFPFTRVTSGTIQVGTASPYSVQVIRNSVLWLGQDPYGGVRVYETSSINPRAISTPAIDTQLEEITDLEKVVSWIYQEGGHTFYVLTGGGLKTSWVYDLTTGLWHERSFNNDGIEEPHRGNNCTYAFGKQLVGDRENGNVYILSNDNLDDNGTPIIRERITSPIFADGKRLAFNGLELGVETGVGQENGSGITPQIALSISKDGGRTYSNAEIKPIGRVGEYDTIVRFRKMGVANQASFKIRISDPVQVAIFGGYLLNLRTGGS